MDRERGRRREEDGGCGCGDGNSFWRGKALAWTWGGRNEGAFTRDRAGLNGTNGDSCAKDRESGCRKRASCKQGRGACKDVGSGSLTEEVERSTTYQLVAELE